MAGDSSSFSAQNTGTSVAGSGWSNLSQAIQSINTTVATVADIAVCDRLLDELSAKRSELYGNAIQRCQQDLIECRAQLVAKDTIITTQQTEIDNLNQEATTLRTSLSTEKEARKDLEGTVQKLEKELEELRNMLQLANGRRKGLQKHLSEQAKMMEGYAKELRKQAEDKDADSERPAVSDTGASASASGSGDSATAP